VSAQPISEPASKQAAGTFFGLRLQLLGAALVETHEQRQLVGARLLRGAYRIVAHRFCNERKRTEGIAMSKHKATGAPSMSKRGLGQGQTQNTATSIHHHTIVSFLGALVQLEVDVDALIGAELRALLITAAVQSKCSSPVWWAHVDGVLAWRDLRV
jgi:hypothetical protein